MNRRPGYRGQPLLVLLMLLAGWMGVRTVLWQTPFPEARATGKSRAATLPARRARNNPAATVEEPLTPPLMSTAWSPKTWGVEPLQVAFSSIEPRSQPQAWTLATTPAAALVTDPSRSAVSAPSPFAAFPQLAGDTTRAVAGRWSGEAWLLLRRDTTTPITSGRGSYGQSQAGAVLRYRLAPRSGHRPAAYGRVSSALGQRDAELAVGLTARPLPGVPLALAAEVRGAYTGEGTEARPAAFAYTELSPVKLPLGARGEAYLQGGWVGGRFETPFVDGQVRIDRTVARLGRVELRAGGGVWGGAQKGAERLDAGPGATVALDLAGSPVRVSADWRFRVAGEAHPHSGPALTVSTGF